MLTSGGWLRTVGQRAVRILLECFLVNLIIFALLGKILHLLLQFTGNVPLDPMYEGLMDSAEEWKAIKSIEGLFWSFKLRLLKMTWKNYLPVMYAGIRTCTGEAKSFLLFKNAGLVLMYEVFCDFFSDSPRSLAHYCRLTVRNCIGTKQLLSNDVIESLPLPQSVHEFLQYKDLDDIT